MKGLIPDKVLRIVLAGSLLFTTSCYSEYVHLDYGLHHGACRNGDHTRVACIISKRAYRPAKGIARFPDGGIPKYLLEEVSLYVYDSRDRSLREAVSFQDLTDYAGSYRSSWKSRLAYEGSLVYYRVTPVEGWDRHLEYAAETKADSQRISALREKYGKPYAFNEKTKEITPVDTAVFRAVCRKEKEVDYMEFHRRLSEVPLSEMGLVIQDIYPKTDREYIRETIYCRNGSAVSRRAVVEQIISKLGRDEIRELLNEMDAYKNSLEGIQKSSYERCSKNVYERMQTLL